VASGGTLQVTATGTYSDASTQDLTGQVLWASSNTAAATIAAGGLATAGGGGATTISATLSGVSGNTTLTVNATLTSIAVTPASPSVDAGGTVQFTATGTYSDASTQDLTVQVLRASSNTAASTIAAGGLATAGVGGATTISATLSGVSGNTTLTVNATLTSIAVAAAELSVLVGTPVQFTATGTYSDASTQDLTEQATWASSDTNVATIDALGVATTLATGPTIISATVGIIVGDATLTVSSPP
jgi:plastocyanin